MEDDALADETVIVSEYGNNLRIHLNRPELLNAFSLEILQACHSIYNRAFANNKNIIITGEGKAFSAGGDLNNIFESPTQVFSQAYSLIYNYFYLKTEKVAIMNGISMGAGGGIPMACSIRIATDKTIWAMPEASFGYVPDTGATYFLSRLNPPEVGLYISLAAARLNGTDCYFFGIANYYIPELTPEMIQDICEADNLKETVGKYHIEPDYKNSKLLPFISDLKMCFNVCENVESVFSRLSMLNNNWARSTLKKLNRCCPLSLKIGYESYRRGKLMDIGSCLVMEFNLATQLLYNRNENFREGVTHKIFEKKRKTRPN